MILLYSRAVLLKFGNENLENHEEESIKSHFFRYQIHSRDLTSLRFFASTAFRDNRTSDQSREQKSVIFSSFRLTATLSPSPEPPFLSCYRSEDTGMTSTVRHRRKSEAAGLLKSDGVFDSAANFVVRPSSPQRLLIYSHSLPPWVDGVSTRFKTHIRMLKDEGNKVHVSFFQ